MLTKDCKVVWYGKMKLDPESIPVIYDPLLIPSIKSCIYLYNAQRDEIIQYTWDIVKNLLVDVDKSEKAAIKKDYDAKWRAARKKLLKSKVNAFAPGGSAPRATSPVAPVEAVDRSWDSVDDDSFELEDLG